MSPLLQRAWVQQEVILAPRVLLFRQQQLLWDCCETKACETFPKGLHPAIRFDKARLEEVALDLPVDMSVPLRAVSEQAVYYLGWWAEILN